MTEVREERTRAVRSQVLPEVLDALAKDILSGRYESGTLLPREPDLCSAYGVSRTVIREVLKVLAAKGMVITRSRVGTMVCDRDNWNIVDPQVLEWYGAGHIDRRLLEAIVETRRAVEPMLAELAASRARSHEIADLESAWRGMAAAGEDLVAYARAEAVFHRTLIATSRNPVFRQIGTLIEASLRSAIAASAAQAGEGRVAAVEARRELVDALRRRDGAAARKAASAVVDQAERALAAMKAAN